MEGFKHETQALAAGCCRDRFCGNDSQLGLSAERETVGIPDCPGHVRRYFLDRNLNAVVTVQVGSQVSGDIKALYADFNTKVTKDQLVALIDPEIFQAKVNQAQANLDNARESVTNAQAAAAKAEADIASAIAARENAKAQLGKAQADLHNADIQLKRRLELVEKGLTTKEDEDNAQAAYDGGLATVEAAKAQINAAESNVTAAQAQHEVTLAQVESPEKRVADGVLC